MSGTRSREAVVKESGSPSSRPGVGRGRPGQRRPGPADARVSRKGRLPGRAAALPPRRQGPRGLRRRRVRPRMRRRLHALQTPRPQGLRVRAPADGLPPVRHGHAHPGPDEAPPRKRRHAPRVPRRRRARKTRRQARDRLDGRRVLAGLRADGQAPRMDHPQGCPCARGRPNNCGENIPARLKHRGNFCGNSFVAQRRMIRKYRHIWHARPWATGDAKDTSTSPSPTGTRRPGSLLGEDGRADDRGSRRRAASGAGRLRRRLGSFRPSGGRASFPPCLDKSWCVLWPASSVRVSSRSRIPAAPACRGASHPPAARRKGRTEEHLLDGDGGPPVLLLVQDRQADGSGRVNVRMEQRRHELALGRLRNGDASSRDGARAAGAGDARSGGAPWTGSRR